MTSPFLTLDISRLIARARAQVPTGIDRVELEYARYLSTHASDRLAFSAVHPLGRYSVLPFRLATDFINTIGARWDNGAQTEAPPERLGMRLLHSIMLPNLPFTRSPFRKEQKNIYLLLSHHHLIKPNLVAAALKQKNTLFVPMIHDLIPLEYPEYSRPKEPARHQKRIATVVQKADAVLTPSVAIAHALKPHFTQAGRNDVPIWPVPLGIHLRATAPITTDTPPETHPYFVCLGTIEGRKNHLLLLNIWRRLVETHGATAPHLILIGKRGWENEQVIDMLDRSPALKSHVKEYNTLPDTDVVHYLRGARALLFPSFTEGFGLPLAEALALHTPIICSDLPVFREIGQKAALYLDPLDGPAWIQAIESASGLNSRPASPLAAVQPGQILHWNDSVGRALSHLDFLTDVAKK